MKRVRIKFSADLVIEGDNMAEVRNKFEALPLFSADAIEECGVEYGETLLIEDADTYEDLTNEYYNNTYKCPECGHVFEQGESDYNYTTGHTDFVCPECDWEGNELEVISE